MTHLDTYIARSVAMMMTFTAVGLVGVLAVFTFLEQIEYTQNEYDMLAVSRYVLYSVPRMFYETIPYVALLGCLAGLGILASNSELLVMRTSGVSTFRIALAAIVPALMLVLTGLAVGEYVLPDVERAARNDRLRALSESDQVTPTAGFWYRENNVFMHFDEVDRTGRVEGITHYYYDSEKRMQRALFARRAEYVRPLHGPPHWMMENVVYTDFSPTRTRSVHRNRLEWHSALEPDLLGNELLVEPSKMSIAELTAKINYMRAQDLETGRFEIGYWQKILQPIATLGLVILALSFVFGPLREASMGTRVVTGLMIGILFQFMKDLLAPASLVFDFAPVLAVAIPIAISVAIGLALLRRAN